MGSESVPEITADTDLEKLLIEPNPVAAPAEPEKATPATPAEPEPVKEPEKAPEPKPGTPDKALQKVQQDLGVALRRIEELTSKIQAGTATPAEQKQVVAQKSKLDSLRATLAAKKADELFDVLDHGDALAESLVEIGEENRALRQRLEQLEAQTQVTQAQAEATAANAAWTQAEMAWPGVDHRAVWDTAKEEAATMISGRDEASLRAIQEVATKLWRERCDNAHRSKAAKSPSKTPPPVAPVPTMGAAEVRAPAAAVSPTPKEPSLMDLAMKLVK